MNNLDKLKYNYFIKNFPLHLNWQESFYAKLTEGGIWDRDEFWKLHRDLGWITSELMDSDCMERDFATDLVWLLSRINELYVAHFDKNDVFQILNLSDDELRQFKERFDVAVHGVFSGELLSEAEFELVNPLIDNNGGFGQDSVD